MRHHDLPRQPRLHRGYHVIPVPDSNEIQLQSEGRALRLQPADSSGLLTTLFAMLDGRRTVDEILDAMPNFDPAQVIDSIERLRDSYLLEDAAPADGLPTDQQEFHASQLSFLAHFTLAPQALQILLAKCSVAVMGLETTGSCLLMSLAESGVGELVGIALPGSSPKEAGDLHDRMRCACTRHNPRTCYRGLILPDLSMEGMISALRGHPLLIVALDRQDPALLTRLNEACIHAGVTWMPAGVRAWEGYVGPTVIPRETACYSCFDLRLKANLAQYEPYRVYEDYLKTGNHDSVFGSLPQFSPIVAGIAATEAVRILTRFHPPVTFGRMFTIDFRNLETRFHEVLKLPRCPTCGEPSQQLPMLKPWTR